MNLDDVKKVVRGFQAVIDMAEAVEKNASLARGADENARILAAKRDEVAGVLKELDDAKAALERAKADGVQIVANARDERAHLLDEAAKEAQGVIALANIKADEITGQAKKDLADLETATAEARGRRDALQADIDAGRAELERVQAAIAELKAKLGG